jgi:hypothetical protein
MDERSVARSLYRGGRLAKAKAVTAKKRVFAPLLEIDVDPRPALIQRKTFPAF